MKLSIKNTIEIAKAEFKHIFKDKGTLLIMAIAVFMYGLSKLHRPINLFVDIATNHAYRFRHAWRNNKRTNKWC